MEMELSVGSDFLDHPWKRREPLSSARLLILLVSIVFLLVIVRRFIGAWFGGANREEEYRKLESGHQHESSHTVSGESPSCPECGSPTELHEYPHLKVWRCTSYPDCRGFAKTRKPSRPKFATDWERKKKK